MVTGRGRLQVALTVLLLLPLTAAGQNPLEALVPLESDTEVEALGLVAPGDLDTSFSGDGIVTTNFINGRSDAAHAVAIQPNGKIVVAGWSFDANAANIDFALTRYNTNGTLDATFGDDGKVLTTFDGGPQGHALAIQPEGKLVIAGADFILARYNTNGTLDATLGDDGKVLTTFDGSAAVYALAIQPRDERLVVAGWSGNSDRVGFALARYHAITCNGVVVTQVGTAGNDTIVGTSGNDVIWGFPGNDLIDGLGGDDILCGGQGSDRCNGGSGQDTAINCEQVTNVP